VAGQGQSRAPDSGVKRRGAARRLLAMRAEICSIAARLSFPTAGRSQDRQGLLDIIKRSARIGERQSDLSPHRCALPSRRTWLNHGDDLRVCRCCSGHATCQPRDLHPSRARAHERRSAHRRLNAPRRGRIHAGTAASDKLQPLQNGIVVPICRRDGIDRSGRWRHPGDRSGFPLPGG